MGFYKKLSTQNQRAFSGTRPVINIHAGELQDYIHHLQSVSYEEMNAGMKSLVRQSANDIKNVYMQFTPQRTSGGRSGKYGATPGNLRRSLKVFEKRQKNRFVVEFTVGYKLHRKGTGKDIKNDGYYGFMVSDGVAGSRANKVPSLQKGNIDFINRARRNANKLIDTGLSDRALRFIDNKLEKLLAKKQGMSAKQYAALKSKYM